jgi:tRNA A37 threonylcarbamoyladenosine dehydratase
MDGDVEQGVMPGNADPSDHGSEGSADRRFGGVARLYGAAHAARIAAAHVVLVGLGGVGSWTAEALARCGVARLTLIDMDHIAVSNINRQIHALDATVGLAKIEAMTQRIGGIAPGTVVEQIDEWVTPENVAQHVTAAADVVIDAIDAPRAKAALIALCVQRGQPIVVCGAAGGRRDPLALRRSDLAHTEGDALLAGVRARLRRDHGFPRGGKEAFAVPALWAPAPEGLRPKAVAAGTALACAGYGSVVMVTAAMGLAAASEALEAVLRGPRA